MKWMILLSVAAILFVVFRLRPSGSIALAEAREYLKKGALLVDVRTAGEFSAGHLPGAVNIPLDRIADTIPSRVPDKNQVLLLHCRSGRRSGIAVTQLRALGYQNVFNIGSYGQAKALLRDISHNE